MTYINKEMVIPQIHDWNHTREILFKLQAALQETEDLYIKADTD